MTTGKKIRLIAERCCKNESFSILNLNQIAINASHFGMKPFKYGKHYTEVG